MKILWIFVIMNSMKSKKPLFLIAVAVAIAGYILWTRFAPEASSSYVAYSEFYQEAEQGLIEAVEITEKKINVVKKSGEKYYTDNPESPTLTEYLLLKEVAVKTAKGAGEIVSLILDILFYVIIFAVFLFVFRKFIGPNRFKVVHNTGVKFDDVVGMDNLKKDMSQVMKIMKNPGEYAKKGIRMPKGILLEGEPGNGKTLFAKALAGESKINFIPAKATDFESMFMAIGPMKVKMLFKKARRKAPCIVFIDEFDGIGTVRNYSGSGIETENTRIVTALLNELDGFQPANGVLVVAATNSIQALDPALIRPGRFDARIRVPYPDESARLKLIEMYTKGKNPSADCKPQVLAQLFEGFSCAKIEGVLNRAALLAGQQNKTEFTLDDVKQAIKEN